MSPLMPAGVYMEPIAPVVKDSTAFFFCRQAKHSQAKERDQQGPVTATAAYVCVCVGGSAMFPLATGH